MLEGAVEDLSFLIFLFTLSLMSGPGKVSGDLLTRDTCRDDAMIYIQIGAVASL